MRLHVLEAQELFTVADQAFLEALDEQFRRLTLTVDEGVYPPTTTGYSLAAIMPTGTYRAKAPEWKQPHHVAPRVKRQFVVKSRSPPPDPGA